MSAPADAIGTASPTAMDDPARPAPFSWSVRREIWEHASLYLAPVIVGAVVLLASLSGAIKFGRFAMGHIQADIQFNGLAPAWAAAAPIAFVQFVILVTTLIVAAFYCLGALYNERRDRSILFWKSLPVSDFTAVAAKAVVPLLVLPIIALVVAFAAEAVCLLIDVVLLPILGVNPALLFQGPLGDLAVYDVCQVVLTTLWWAPVWAWLIAVSAWAKRAPFLWAVGVPLALAVFELIAVGRDDVWRIIGNRLNLAMPTQPTGVVAMFGHHVGHPTDIAAFFERPGLWIGLAVAAALFAAAVRLRKGQGPS
ncbi:MAG: hypothetical protein ACREEX_02475 [Caulobacteraceae bacterium]